MACLWAVLLIYGSLLPWQFSLQTGGLGWAAVWAWITSPTWIPITNEASSLGIPVWLSDMVLNLVLYGPLGVMLRLTLSRMTGRHLVQIATASLLVVSLSWLIESTQSLIPGRYGSIQDVLNNSFGGIVGVLLGHRINRTWRGTAFTAYRWSARPRRAIDQGLDRFRQRPAVLYTVLMLNGLLVTGWYLTLDAGQARGGGVNWLPFAGYFSRSYDVAAVLMGRSLVVYCLIGGVIMLMTMRGATRTALSAVLLAVALAAGVVELVQLTLGKGYPDVTEPLLAVMAGGFVLTLAFMGVHACRCTCRRRAQVPVPVDRRGKRHDYRFALSADNQSAGRNYR